MQTWKVCIVACASLTLGTAWAAPGLINYQGRLTDASGNPIITPVNVTFTFHDAETAGTQLGTGFSDTDTVTPDADGIYSTLIGDDPGNLVPSSVFDGDFVWLNVNVGGEDLVPRLRIISVGFAIHADTAATAVSAGHADTADSAAHASAADIATTADTAGHANSADTATNADQASHANTASHADTATTATTATDSQALEGLHAGDFLQMSADAYVIVKTTANPTQNGANLLAAYALAKSLTPNGAPLGTDNRAVVLVPPGTYDLGTGTFTMNADFVDLVGLSTVREDQTIQGTSFVLTQTAADVRIENLVLHYTGGGIGVFAYRPNVTWDDGTSHTGSPPQTTIRNCVFRAISTSMRYTVEYAGTYEDCMGEGLYTFGGNSGTASGTFINCTGGDRAFGGYYGAASGTFINCTGGAQAFGGYFGTASGTFTDCTGGALYAFAGHGTASGVFTNCTAGDRAFGGEFGTASGTFTGCSAGDNSFGYRGTAGGTFSNCTGGNYAFGGFNGTADGTFTNCTGALGAFGGGSSTTTTGSAGGTFTNCTGGDYAFGGGSGCTATGQFRNCRMEGLGFPWIGTFNGRMEDCRWGAGITCDATARIYRSTILGSVDLNNTAAGIAHSEIKGTILNAASASFNSGNLEDPGVN